MTDKQKNEVLFNAFLKIAVSNAFQKEMEELPSCEELNERFPIDDEFDEKMTSLINGHDRKIKTNRFIKRFGKIAAVVAVVFTILSATLLSVEASRNAIFNAVLTWNEKSIKIEFSDPQDGLYRPGYLPEGYNEVSIDPIGKITMITYINESGEELLFDQEPLESGSAMMDNEKREYKQIELSSGTAYLFEAESEELQSGIIWQKHGAVFRIIACLPSDELIKIAESV